MDSVSDVVNEIEQFDTTFLLPSGGIFHKSILAIIPGGFTSFTANSH